MNKEDKKMDNLARNIERYSYQDLLDMDDENRYEIIDGELYLMSSPSVIHQMLVGEIYFQIRSYLQGKKCKVFVSPLDVRFSKEKDFKKIWDVVEPDIMVVCDQDKIDEKGIAGAPDVLIEVLSPSTRRRDKLQKFNLYQQKGVKEYWWVDPEEMVVYPYVLNKEGIYTLAKIYALEEPIKIQQLKNCTINLKDFIEENKNLF